MVGSSEARPTKQSVTVFDVLNKELEGYLTELRTAWKDLLPPVDAFLRDKGKPAIEVRTESPSGPRP